MPYYHIRYNIYENQGAPVEKEVWTMFETPTDDFELRRHFEDKHQSQTSIIMSKVINLEEFELNHHKE